MATKNKSVVVKEITSNDWRLLMISINGIYLIDIINKVVDWCGTYSKLTFERAEECYSKLILKINQNISTDEMYNYIDTELTK